MSFLSDLFGGGGAAAAGRAGQAIQKGFQQATGDVKKYGAQAIGTEQQALPQWQTIFGQGTAMQPYYMGGLGVGTPQQVSAANQAFMSSIPGQEYQRQLPDIYEAALRRGGLTGQTGQIPIDLTNETMKALNQFYPGWQKSLDPYSYETAGATGESNVYGNIADIQSGIGKSLGSLALGAGQARGQTIQNQFAANAGADANILNALFGLGSLGVGAYGMATRPAPVTNIYG